MNNILLVVMLLIASVAYTSSCPQVPDDRKSIDKIVSRYVDVDGDGVEDKIELHVMGKDFFSPFRWQLKIYSKGTIIYQQSKDNARIEPLFSDPNYIGGCTGYAECKCQWFFEKFLGRLIVGRDRFADAVFDKSTPNSIYVTMKQHLKKEYKENPNLVDKAIQNAAIRLRSGKAVAIVVPDEPEMPTPPMIWMPEFRRFVPVYED
jgi:hypothetical protein